MVKKFLVIALAMALVAPGAQASVSEQIQTEAELRFSELTGRTLTAEDREVLKAVVETTLEEFPVPSESKLTAKNVAIAVGVAVAVLGVAWGIGYWYSGEWYPFSKKFITSRAENKKVKEFEEGTNLVDGASARREAYIKADKENVKVVEEREVNLDTGECIVDEDE